MSDSEDWAAWKSSADDDSSEGCLLDNLIILPYLTGLQMRVPPIPEEEHQTANDLPLSVFTTQILFAISNLLAALLRPIPILRIQLQV